MREARDMLEQSQVPAWPGIPKNFSEYITLIAHYYRAEIARMSGWRDRIDRTTNWAITVAGAMLSVSLSTATSHHALLLFAMILVLLLPVIEARRYRFFDGYRARVRLLERQYFARVFAAVGERGTSWVDTLSNDLQRPVFLMGYGLAFSRRLRVKDDGSSNTVASSPCLCHPSGVRGGKRGKSRFCSTASADECCRRTLRSNHSAFLAVAFVRRRNQAFSPVQHQACRHLRPC
jgi:hypothetical protein